MVKKGKPRISKTKQVKARKATAKHLVKKTPIISKQTVKSAAMDNPVELDQSKVLSTYNGSHDSDGENQYALKGS